MHKKEEDTPSPCSHLLAMFEGSYRSERQGAGKKGTAVSQGRYGWNGIHMRIRCSGWLSKVQKVCFKKVCFKGAEKCFKALPITQIS